MSDEKMTVGSLFAGIGGIELGLERTGGFETVWQVEKDEYCRRVLSKHWPSVDRYEDVREVGADELDEVDLICGGFPCQDISLAHNNPYATTPKQEGLDGERSGLWSEFARIVDELRPRYVLAENVEALRYKTGELGVVLSNLAQIGYDAEWHCLSASSFGSPQKRTRTFILAYPNSGNVEAHGDTREGPIVSREGLDEFAESRQGQDARRRWSTEPGVGRMATRSSAWVDRIRGLGNAVVPQATEFIGDSILRRLSDRHEDEGSDDA